MYNFKIFPHFFPNFSAQSSFYPITRDLQVLVHNTAADRIAADSIHIPLLQGCRLSVS